jgi:hypothetical protein
MTKRLLLVIAAAIVIAPGATSQSAGPPVTVIGDFSNLRFTEEHAYGYSVQLWRQGTNNQTTVFGLFMASEGLAGDTPAGNIENVQFDAGSGKLSFQAKLTLGVELDDTGRQQPSRDFFEFKGVLQPTELVGTVRHSDRRHPQVPAAAEQVTLKRQEHESADMPAPRDYRDWQTSVAGILKRRGPKW